MLDNNNILLRRMFAGKVDDGNNGRKGKEEPTDTKEETVTVQAPEAEAVTASAADVMDSQGRTLVRRTGNVLHIGSNSFILDGVRVNTYVGSKGNLKYIQATGPAKNLIDKVVEKVEIMSIDRTEVRTSGKSVEGENGVNGEIDETVMQGDTGDCWLIAGIMAMVSTPAGKAALKDCIRVNGDGSVTVTFKGVVDVDGKPFEITISAKELAEYNRDLGAPGTHKGPDYSTGDDDMLVLELAVEKLYARLEQMGALLGNEEDYKFDEYGNPVELVNDNDEFELLGAIGAWDKEGNPLYVSIDDGGFASQIIYYLTGIKSKDIFPSDAQTWQDLVNGLDPNDIYAELNNACANENMSINFGIYRNAGEQTYIPLVDPETGKFSGYYCIKFGEAGGHEFAVTKVWRDDNGQGYVNFVNPSNTSQVMTMTWENFALLKIGNLSVADLSSLLSAQGGEEPAASEEPDEVEDPKVPTDSPKDDMAAGDKPKVFADTVDAFLKGIKDAETKDYIKWIMSELELGMIENWKGTSKQGFENYIKTEMQKLSDIWEGNMAAKENLEYTFYAQVYSVVSDYKFPANVTNEQKAEIRKQLLQTKDACIDSVKKAGHENGKSSAIYNDMEAFLNAEISKLVGNTKPEEPEETKEPEAPTTPEEPATTETPNSDLKSAFEQLRKCTDNIADSNDKNKCREILNEIAFNSNESQLDRIKGYLEEEFVEAAERKDLEDRVGGREVIKQLFNAAWNSTFYTEVLASNGKMETGAFIDKLKENLDNMLKAIANKPEMLDVYKAAGTTTKVEFGTSDGISESDKVVLGIGIYTGYSTGKETYDNVLHLHNTESDNKYQTAMTKLFDAIKAKYPNIQEAKLKEWLETAKQQANNMIAHPQTTSNATWYNYMLAHRQNEAAVQFALNPVTCTIEQLVAKTSECFNNILMANVKADDYVETTPAEKSDNTQAINAKITLVNHLDDETLKEIHALTGEIDVKAIVATFGNIIPKNTIYTVDKYGDPVLGGNNDQLALHARLFQQIVKNADHNEEDFKEVLDAIGGIKNFEKLFNNAWCLADTSTGRLEDFINSLVQNLERMVATILIDSDRIKVLTGHTEVTKVSNGDDTITLTKAKAVVFADGTVHPNNNNLEVDNVFQNAMKEARVMIANSESYKNVDTNLLNFCFREAQKEYLENYANGRTTIQNVISTVLAIFDKKIHFAESALKRGAEQYE